MAPRISENPQDSERLARGIDRRAEFESQALPHLPALRRLSRRLCRNEKDAEDLVQDTYLRAFRFFHRFESGTNIRAWLYRILRNQFLNRIQQDRPEVSADLDVVLRSGGVEILDFSAGPIRNPEEAAMDSAAAAQVEAAVASLPEEYRPVVTLALKDELSYKEISRALGIPMGTVMSRLHRGRKILQGQLIGHIPRRGRAGRDPLQPTSP